MSCATQKMVKRYLVSAGLLAGVLAACAVKPDPQAIGPYPDDYRGVVKAYVEETFYDPYSMRNVALSNPQQGHVYFEQGWVVCLQANAKNRMGAYTGLKRTALLINRDRVINMMEEAPFCDQVTLSPWPEMEGKS